MVKAQRVNDQGHIATICALKSIGEEYHPLFRSLISWLSNHIVNWYGYTIHRAITLSPISVITLSVATVKSFLGLLQIS